jgi:hypothetical protein
VRRRLLDTFEADGVVPARERPWSEAQNDVRQARRARQLRQPSGPFRKAFGESLADIVEHDVGPMTVVCGECNALRFKEEPKGMCCMSGAVVLPELQQPPEPLWGLLMATDAPSRAFRQGIRLYNSAFNMASSTAKVERRFPHGVQAFRINGVVHRSGECLNDPRYFPHPPTC